MKAGLNWFAKADLAVCSIGIGRLSTMGDPWQSSYGPLEEKPNIATDRP